MVIMMPSCIVAMEKSSNKELSGSGINADMRPPALEKESDFDLAGGFKGIYEGGPKAPAPTILEVMRLDQYVYELERLKKEAQQSNAKK